MTLNLFTFLCFATLVQLLGLQITADSAQGIEIKLSVIYEINQQPPLDYDAIGMTGGTLLGAMRRLQESNQNFNFTVSENPDYGYYLESVNGVVGSSADHTYWEILSDSDGEPTPTPVGVGCYIPKENDHIIFKFTTW